MKRTNVFLITLLIAAALVTGIVLSSCSDMLSPENTRFAEEVFVREEANFSRVELPSATTPIEVCCGFDGGGSTSNVRVVLENNNSFWGSRHDASPSAQPDDFFGPHWINIDLGREYSNISRIEYRPSPEWGAPGGYNESWVGGPNRNNGNGIVTSFEIYLTDEPILRGETPPADRRVAVGWWYALERSNNHFITLGNSTGNSVQRFFATFDSARGRYLQFRMLEGYRNDWRNNLSNIAQVSQLHVFESDRPYQVNMTGLQEAVHKSEFLSHNFPPNYGYINALLTNLHGRAQAFLNDRFGATAEGVQYVQENLNQLIRQAASRIAPDTYNRFAQKILWSDNNGSHISAHGGGLMWDPVTKKWWWYGEDRTSWRNNMTGGGQPGVHAYSSTDMYNWVDEGLALPIFNNTEYDQEDWGASYPVGDPGRNWRTDAHPGGWDGTQNNPSGLFPAATTADPAVSGFIWDVNDWRKALGDWNADGYITPGGEYYANARVNPSQSGFPNPTNASIYIRDPVTNLRGPRSPAEIMEAWNKIKDFIPADNEPLYLWQDSRARPFATSMGLTEAKVRELNSMYSDVPAWRRKQIYRWWNWTTTVERPKVIYNAGQGPYKVGTGTHALTGNPIEPYRDATGTYPYVMSVHIEGGAQGIGYGTARALIAVAKHPAGPFKVLWAYKTHFSENVLTEGEGSNPGKTRDQSLLVDDDGTAYHFGSTVQNLIMCISILDETYTQFIGIPRFAGGTSYDQFIEEGVVNYLGRNFNYVYGNQREAPAPFLHYWQDGMTYEGLVRADGTLGPVAPSQKYYYNSTSTSTGWFPNPLGVYRTSAPGGRILGGNGTAHPDNGHPKPPAGGTQGNIQNRGGTGAGSAPSTTDVNSGSGWTSVYGNNWDNNNGNGNASTFLFGAADDGSNLAKGYDGQTTYVQQLRYPDFVWDIVGFLDDDFVPLDTDVFDTPESYNAELRRLYDTNEFTFPIYGETAQREPRAGRLVWGKYIQMLDSWDNTKNYDARYIWIPLRVIQGSAGGTIATNTAGGARARWMREWRWQDFVYDLGPFANSLTASPAAIKDSRTPKFGANQTSNSMWSSNGLPNATTMRNLQDYYDMLNRAWGSSEDWFMNPGKQNPGQYWEWLNWLLGT